MTGGKHQANRFFDPARLSPRRAYRGLWKRLFRSPLYRITLPDFAPKGFTGAPPAPLPRSSEQGKEILAGTFRLAGHQIAAEDGCWRTLAASEESARELHGFAWLRDLRAAGGEDAAPRARALIRGWLETHGNWGPVSWRSDVLGERLVNWLAAYDFLGPGAEPEFTEDLIGSALVQARHLKRTASWEVRDAGAIRAAKGLIYCGICLPQKQDLLEAGSAVLERETARQILPDGGHFERCPSLHLRVLEDLVDIRETLTAFHEETPVYLQAAIDRMTPMLRGLRLGDGGLAVFNGGVEEDAAMIDGALARTAVRGKAQVSAPHSGFQRLAAGRTLVLVDAGGTPPGTGPEPHAEALSFEMSVGKHRLVVNCGARKGADAAWQRAQRATAAHSTLSVDDADSEPVFNGYGGGDVQRRETGGSIWLDAAHHGYQRRFGLTHRRKLYMEASGEDFRGEDTLTGPGGNSFALRFHLHPGVQASLVEGGRAVLLRLGKRPVSGWRFRADGGEIGLEESIYLGGDGRGRRTSQIVVRGPLGGDGASVKWRFDYISS